MWEEWKYSFFNFVLITWSKKRAIFRNFMKCHFCFLDHVIYNLKCFWNTHTYTNIYIYKQTCVFVSMYAYMCVCLSLCVCLYTCVCDCVHVHMYRKPCFKIFYSIVCFYIKSFIYRKECVETCIKLHSLKFSKNCFRDILIPASSECMCFGVCIHEHSFPSFLLRSSQLTLLWCHI